MWTRADARQLEARLNECFLPVMGLMFLHHAYSRYLAVKDATAAGLPTLRGRERPVTREDFSQKNTLFLRPDVRCDHLVARHNGPARTAAIFAAAQRRPNSTP